MSRQSFLALEDTNDKAVLTGASLLILCGLLR